MKNEAKRGALKFVAVYLNFLKNKDQKKHVVVWSDSCARQNNKFSIVLLYQYLLLNDYAKIIDHKLEIFLPGNCQRMTKLWYQIHLCRIAHISLVNSKESHAGWMI